MVREIIRNSLARKILAGYALTVEENVFGLQGTREIRLTHDARRHVSIQSPSRRIGIGVGLLYSIAVGVVDIAESRGGADAVFGIVDVTCAVVVFGHVAGCI